MKFSFPLVLQTLRTSEFSQVSTFLFSSYPIPTMKLFYVFITELDNFLTFYTPSGDFSDYLNNFYFSELKHHFWCCEVQWVLTYIDWDLSTVIWYYTEEFRAPKIPPVLYLLNCPSQTLRQIPCAPCCGVLGFPVCRESGKWPNHFGNSLSLSDESEAAHFLSHSVPFLNVCLLTVVLNWSSCVPWVFMRTYSEESATQVFKWNNSYTFKVWTDSLKTVPFDSITCTKIYSSFSFHPCHFVTKENVNL